MSKRQAFSVLKYFRDNSMEEKYPAFCAWCYRKSRRISMKSIRNEEELELRLSEWEEENNNKVKKFAIKPWFLKTHSETEYPQFYSYCRNKKHISFSRLHSGEEVASLISEWEAEEEYKKSHPKFYVTREFHEHPEYGYVNYFISWHKETYKCGTRFVPENVLKKRILEYLSSK